MKKWVICLCVLLFCILPVSAEVVLTEDSDVSALLWSYLEERMEKDEQGYIEYPEVYPDEYAGHWTEDGKLHLALVAPDPDMLETYQLLFGETAKDVVYHDARYSMNDLNRLGREYLERIGEYTAMVCGWTIQQKYNCVALEFVGDAVKLEEAMKLAEVPEGLFSIGIQRGMSALPEVVPPDVGNRTSVLGAYQLLAAALPTLDGDGNAYPAAYTGCWAEDGTLCIGLTTTDTTETVRYEKLLENVTCPYRFVKCDYSYNQLIRLKDAVMEQLWSDPQWGLVSVGINIRDCLIHVGSRNGWSEELQQQLYRIAEEEGLGDNAVLLDEGAWEIVAQALDQVEYAPETTDLSLPLFLWAVCTGTVMLYIRKKKYRT